MPSVPSPPTPLDLSHEPLGQETSCWYELVSRKIASTLARIKFGLQSEGRLSDSAATKLEACRGQLRAMHPMLKQSEPDDYVVAAGESHSVREFCEVAFGEAGLDYRECVGVDPWFYWPSETDLLQGDASKAHKRLRWNRRLIFFVSSVAKWFTPFGYVVSQ